MRQRNDTGYGADVMAWPTDEHPDRRPFFVAAGEETDFPELIPGFRALDEPSTPEPAAPSAKTKKSAAASATSTEGSESA